MEMGSWDSPLMISDDDEEPAPAGAEQPEEPNLEVPDWVPDGWTVEACRLDDGIINWYYTCPVTDFTFTMKSEVMQYIHSGAAEHALQAKATLDDETTLQGKYSWLPLGWMIEIRAGGDDMQKMFKFFVHESSGVRLSSKEDVLLYENEGKISKCSTNEECDTSSKDNMIAQLEFNIKGLPAGWVKETTFRKCNNGMRKDPYFTDPVNHYVFRTWESAEIYFSTGEIISSNVYFERKSVTKKYSFDKCTNMPEWLIKILKREGREKQRSKIASMSEKELHIDQTLPRCIIRGYIIKGQSYHRVHPSTIDPSRRVAPQAQEYAPRHGVHSPCGRQYDATNNWLDDMQIKELLLY